MRTPWSAGGVPSFQPMDEGLMNEAFFECFQDMTAMNQDLFNMLDLEMGGFGTEGNMYHL
jgi:hypothetical protein